MTSQRSLLTADEVAEEFQVHAETVRQWGRLGKLVVVRTPGGKLVRFRRSEVEALINGDQAEAGAA